jgi:predicted nucleic acid-binding protein
VIVVDASAVVDVVVPGRADPELTELLRMDGDLHAPHLVDVEVTQALRRLVRARELADDRASDARVDVADLPITRHPHRALLDRAWQLRHNLSVYDAVYIALAELLQAPLVTCDARLAQAFGHGAEIQLFAAN